MKSEIETVNKSSGVLLFGITCLLASTLAALIMAAWGFTVYLA